MSRARRYELWSDLPFADPPGTRLAFVPRDQVLSAVRTQDVDGTDTLELGFALDSFAWSQVGDRGALATLLEDGTLIWHRIERRAPERQPDGARIGSVVARSILLDLDNTVITSADADGTTYATYPLATLTVDELVDLIMEQMPVQFVKGTIEQAARAVPNFGFDIDSPLSALTRLAELAEVELWISGDGETPFHVHLLEQIGADAPVPEFRYRKNLVAVRRTSDSKQLANVLYAFGANEGGIRATMAAHLFDVDSVLVYDATHLTVYITNADVIVEDGALDGRGLRRIRHGSADADYKIIATDLDSNWVLVEDVGGGAPDVIASDQVRFLLNPPLAGTPFDGNLLPDGDVDTTGWTTAPLFSKIDDGDTPDTGDYIETSSSSLTIETKDCEVSLTNPGASVDAGSIHRLKVYARALLQEEPGSAGKFTANMTLALYQGSTLIASYLFKPSESFNWVTFDLSGAEIAAISDYTDLRIRLTAAMRVFNSGDIVYIDVATGHLKIVSDLDSEPGGAGLIFVESPSSKAAYGEVRSRIEYGDVVLVHNLVANPALRDWTGGVPDGWDLVGSPTVTQEISPLYTRFGGSSAKYGSATADLGLVTEDIDITPTETKPYFSAFVIVWNESDDGFRFFLEWDTATDTFVSPAVEVVTKNDWIKCEIAGLELPTDATTMRLKVLANSASSTPWYLDAALLVQAATLPEAFSDTPSANVLWYRAVRELRRRSVPAISYELQAKDLTAIDPSTWPHDALTLGGSIRIIDRDLAVSETLRLTRIRRNLLTGADVDLDVESIAQPFTPGWT